MQLAGELQGPVDKHPDAPAQQLLGSNGGAELPGGLGVVADRVEATLDPLRTLPHTETAPKGAACDINVQLIWVANYSPSVRQQ